MPRGGAATATAGRRPATVSCPSWVPGCSGGPLPRGGPCSLRRFDPGADATAEPSARRLVAAEGFREEAAGLRVAPKRIERAFAARHGLRLGESVPGA
eukprot:1877920-Pyramimonas_sp.AAC.1